nr:hypothetical protein [Tanacetum cinerariifolium]
MSTPIFAETHNLVAFLEKPFESEGFEQIIDFLNAKSIKYALTVNPTVYASCVKQFWTTTKVKRYQANPKGSHLVVVKRIFKHLKGTSNLGLWYPKGSGFDLKAYFDLDYVGCNLDRKSTLGAETEYVAATGCCAQVFWIKSQLAEYDVLYDKGSHDQLNLNQQTIAYSLIWGLEIEIGAIIFSDLVHKLKNRKKNKEANICYTRFLSLIFEKLLGENYINDALTFIKPHTILAASFQKTISSEAALTSHMLKVSKLFQEPKQSLILSFEKVNVDDGADKSLSKTTVVILPKKQVAKTQHVKKTMAIADATQSLEASESAEDQVLDQNIQEEVKESGLESMGDVTFDQIMDEIDQKTKAAEEKLESPYDTESKIKIIKSFMEDVFNHHPSDIPEAIVL